MVSIKNHLVLQSKLVGLKFKITKGFQSKFVPDKLDAIVIGSGIGGLATAAILSKAGKKVLVLEQHDQAGGCCHTFTENGFEFDVGECIYQPLNWIGMFRLLFLNHIVQQDMKILQNY